NVGTIFELPAGTHSIVTLASFNGATGSGPTCKLVADANGNLYGVAPAGGAYGFGSIFEYSASTRTLTTLVSFNGTNGAGPRAGLVFDSSGNLFGTTRGFGGAGIDNYGTVFELPAGAHDIVTLVSFDYSNGAWPLGELLLDAAGNIYGTTSGG